MDISDIQQILDEYIFYSYISFIEKGRKYSINILMFSYWGYFNWWPELSPPEFSPLGIFTPGSFPPRLGWETSGGEEL